MRRSVHAPRFAVLLSVAGAFAWSACSGDGRDFFGDPGPSGGTSAAGSSGVGGSAGTAGAAASGGSGGSSAGQGGTATAGSGGSATAGSTSTGGSSGSDAGEGGGGGTPDGQAGETNGGAGMGGSPNDAGAPSHGGGSGDAGMSGGGGSSGSGGTSGGTDASGGTSGSGGISGSAGTNASGGTGGTPPPVCRSGADCSTTEYCKKSSCAAETGECAPRPEACKGTDAVFAPVCGCDAMTYFSACVAAREGTNVASNGECNTATGVACTRTAGGDSCSPTRKLARCYRPRTDCNQASPSTGTCWVLPDECPANEPKDAYYCRGTAGEAACVGLCEVLNREDSMVRNATQCK